MTQLNPLQLAHHLKEAYLRYYDTAYWLDNQALMDERRALVDAEGHLLSDIYLEPIQKYANTDLLSDVLSEIGFELKLGQRLFRALFNPPHDLDPSKYALRKHQADAIRHSFRHGTADGRNIAVTSGTGSGKTESFWFPILLRILSESTDWNESFPTDYWWEKLESEEWKPLRESETRMSAIRAMVLYPTNALVEDQITRLRRTIGTLCQED